MQRELAQLRPPFCCGETALDGVPVVSMADDPVAQHERGVPRVRGLGPQTVEQPSGVPLSRVGPSRLALGEQLDGLEQPMTAQAVRDDEAAIDEAAQGVGDTPGVRPGDDLFDLLQPECGRERTELHEQVTAVGIEHLPPVVERGTRHVARSGVQFVRLSSG